MRQLWQIKIWNSTFFDAFWLFFSQFTDYFGLNRAFKPTKQLRWSSYILIFRMKNLLSRWQPKLDSIQNHHAADCGKIYGMMENCRTKLVSVLLYKDVTESLSKNWKRFGKLISILNFSNTFSGKYSSYLNEPIIS